MHRAPEPRLHTATPVIPVFIIVLPRKSPNQKRPCIVQICRSEFLCTTSMSASSPSKLVTDVFATFYVLSGVSQPMIMTICKNSGLADPSAQLYMVWYYCGPALLILSTLAETWPSRLTITKACGTLQFHLSELMLRRSFAIALNFSPK